MHWTDYRNRNKRCKKIYPYGYNVYAAMVPEENFWPSEVDFVMWDPKDIPELQALYDSCRRREKPYHTDEKTGSGEDEHEELERRYATLPAEIKLMILEYIHDVRIPKIFLIRAVPYRSISEHVCFVYTQISLMRLQVLAEKRWIGSYYTTRSIRFHRRKHLEDGEIDGEFSILSGERVSDTFINP